jgi:hypothetical protein
VPHRMRQLGPLRVTCGKTLCEYMFSELPQITDIVGSVGSPGLPETCHATIYLSLIYL